ncbi:hypothetical protein [Glaciecola sp. KUL10]|uniref:hypothetical protein n=1 Tax=Glaciecola sp. (strain KUL10) TaxID=2161813 RepID=UPI000D782374|nr:hypothetical protein [Glaciecola sp. KUL10]GBL02950.1 hypothetical protein KUL10_02230 [Glaciecola sp. KUL10]
MDILLACLLGSLVIMGFAFVKLGIFRTVYTSSINEQMSTKLLEEYMKLYKSSDPMDIKLKRQKELHKKIVEHLDSLEYVTELPTELPDNVTVLRKKKFKDAC